ncbi:ROK family protein [Nakamurella deserti]|uniref:ROK family protein n=1 Tax=Nakamurella deserti TaxID=2164074 RepID=UPI000DBE32A5|nr:ROK family protein [Nakamurella deserti]
MTSHDPADPAAVRDRGPAHTVGVDIGGTTIKAAVIDRSGRIVDTLSAPTPDTTDATDDALVAVISELAERHPVRAVGLAVAGFITADRQSVMFAPHLAYRDSRVPSRLGDRLGLPVVMEHDVNAAVWAEHRIGAAVGADVALLIALGTGIGAGLIVGERIYRGAFGVAPELGHITVVPGGRPCPCGKVGCWERYCSGTALAQTAAERGMEAPGPITGQLVGRAARDGHPTALAAVDDLGEWLARGMALAIDVFDPEVIVIGGGVSSIADLFLPAAEDRLGELVTGAGYRPMPKVVAAHLHDTASMVGAGLLARDPHH